MPRCPRCSGFLQVGVGSCPLCRATFAPLEAGEEDGKRPEPLRVVPVVPDPDVQTSWGRRATEAGFVMGLALCVGLALLSWLEGGGLFGVGGGWLYPLLLVLVSPLAGMYTGIAFGAVAVASEPLLKWLWRRLTGAEAVVPPADMGGEKPAERALPPREGVIPAEVGGPRTVQPPGRDGAV